MSKVLLRFFKDAEELKGIIGNDEVAFIYRQHVSVFKRVKEIFKALIGKAPEMPNVELVPVTNFRQFQAAQKKYKRRLILGTSWLMSMIALNGQEGDEVVVDLSGFNTVPEFLPNEIHIIKQPVRALVKADPKAQIAVHGRSLEGFQQVDGIDSKHIVTYNGKNDLKIALNNGAYLMYCSDVRMNNDMYSALFRPVHTVKFLVAPKTTTQSDTGTEVANVQNVEDIFD